MHARVRMMMDLAERFMSALRRAEDEGDLSMLTHLFTDDARLENPLIGVSIEQREPVDAFWKRSLELFDEPRSYFGDVTKSGTMILMEWFLVGKNRLGDDVTLKALLMLEATQDVQRIRCFRAYVDPEHLVAVA